MLANTILTTAKMAAGIIGHSHALVAEIAFCLAVAIAFFHSRFYRALRSIERGAAPSGTANVLVAIVFLQIFAGATVRHFGAALAIPDFPLSFGRLVPPLHSLPVVLKIKEAINRAYESSLAEGMLFERRAFHALFATEDQKEGMAAFLEKRKPGFKHR